MSFNVLWSFEKFVDYFFRLSEPFLNLFFVTSGGLTFLAPLTTQFLASRKIDFYKLDEVKIFSLSSRQLINIPNFIKKTFFSVVVLFSSFSLQNNCDTFFKFYSKRTCSSNFFTFHFAMSRLHSKMYCIWNNTAVK